VPTADSAIIPIVLTALRPAAALLLLQDVREQMAAGTWLCPHCYEEEHPEEGWMCNSSICMTRRGFRPTGASLLDPWLTTHMMCTYTHVYTASCLLPGRLLGHHTCAQAPALTVA
jgi:hypothetical protein